MDDHINNDAGDDYSCNKWRFHVINRSSYDWDDDSDAYDNVEYYVQEQAKKDNIVGASYYDRNGQQKDIRY